MTNERMSHDLRGVTALWLFRTMSLLNKLSLLSVLRLPLMLVAHKTDHTLQL